MYYLTVEKNGEKICYRLPYHDYSEALEACATYYKPIAKRSILKFTTETINGIFTRSYAELNRPETILITDKISERRYAVAAKMTNSFEYEDSLFFLVESVFGVEDTDTW